MTSRRIVSKSPENDFALMSSAMVVPAQRTNCTHAPAIQRRGSFANNSAAALVGQSEARSSGVAMHLFGYVALVFGDHFAVYRRGKITDREQVQCQIVSVRAYVERLLQSRPLLDEDALFLLVDVGRVRWPYRTGGRSDGNTSTTAISPSGNVCLPGRERFKVYVRPQIAEPAQELVGDGQSAGGSIIVDSHKVARLLMVGEVVGEGADRQNLSVFLVEVVNSTARTHDPSTVVGCQACRVARSGR